MLSMILLSTPSLMHIRATSWTSRSLKVSWNQSDTCEGVKVIPVSDDLVDVDVDVDGAEGGVAWMVAG